MKKEYIAPLATMINVESISMIAASSIDINKGDTSIDSGTGQLSNKDRGEWGNLWD